MAASKCNTVHFFLNVSFICVSFRVQFVWSLSGHSGDSHDIPLVQFNKYPKNAADRLAPSHSSLVFALSPFIVVQIKNY
jgi:hypothetical protein